MINKTVTTITPMRKADLCCFINNKGQRLVGAYQLSHVLFNSTDNEGTREMFTPDTKKIMTAHSQSAGPSCEGVQVRQGKSRVALFVCVWPACGKGFCLGH